MSTQPVDDHSEEFEQLAGLVALRVLEGEELERFEQHADHCEQCQLMLRLDRESLSRLSLAATEMDPSPDFKQRLMRRAAEELARSATAVEPPPAPPQPETQDEPIPLRPPPQVVPFWRRSPWLSALAAVIVLGLVSVGAYSYENQPIATYTLSGTTPGVASVVLRRSGAAELDMSGVPNPEAGFVYEAWIIPAGAGKTPVAAGITATGNATLKLDGDVRGATVAITEERGRVDAPTGTPVLATVVPS